MILQHDLIEPVLDGRVFKEAKSLVQNGYDVHLITWSVRLNSKKYKKDFKKEGINIHRIFLQTKTKEGSNPFSKIILFNKLHLITKKLIAKIKPNIIHSHDILPFLAGYQSAKKIKAKFIYDSHELHPHSDEKFILRKIYKLIELMYISKVDFIFCANQPRKNIMIKHYPKIKNKILELNNYPPLENKKIVVSKNKLVKFVYQGGMLKYRGIDKILCALATIKEKPFEFHFFGGNEKQLEPYTEIIKKNNLQNKVYLHGSVTVKKLYKELERMDVGVMVLQNSSLNSYYCAPNKLYEYEKAGLATLSPNFPHIKKEVEEKKIGITCDFTKPESIAEGLSFFIENKKNISKMKERARENYLKNDNWKTEEKKLVKI